MPLSRLLATWCLGGMGLAEGTKLPVEHSLQDLGAVHTRELTDLS